MPKELSEVINRRRAGNAMANRKRKKMIHSLIKTTQKTEDWVARIPLKTLSDDLFLCQVSKGSTVRFEFNIFCTLVTMATVAILNFFQPPKSCHTLRWIFLQSFMKFDERNPKTFLIPPFLFLWQLRQSLSNRLWFFLAYLVPLDVVVAPNKCHQFLFGE